MWGFRTLMRAIGSNGRQDSDISWHSIDRAHFRISSFLKHWDLFVECRWKFYSKIPSHLLIYLRDKGSLITTQKELGNPNWGMISLSNTLTTSLAFFEWVGNASVLTSKLFIGTNICTDPPCCGMWLKSGFHSSPSYVLLSSGSYRGDELARVLVGTEWASFAG